jgi:transposase
VEGLNNKAKVTMRKSYGFRTFRVLELALYHSLGKLPEPESTHGFLRAIFIEETREPSRFG